MEDLTAFQVGTTYTNDQIRFSLQIENLGGIRPALDSAKNLRHVAIMTAALDSGKVTIDNPYQDRIEGDILVFTGQGRTGDQQLSGRNKRLTEQYTNVLPIFGFVNEGRQSYRFLGLLELLRYHQEIQADRHDLLRKVLVFEFKIHSMPETVPIAHAREITSELLAARLATVEIEEQDREVVELSTELPRESLPAPSQIEIEHIRAALARVSPYNFEHLVKTLMERSGFVEVQVTRASADGGIDIVGYVGDDNRFLAGTFVQAQVKRWRHAVGSVELNNFRGAMDPVAKGIFITTSTYTRAAIAEARKATKTRISLIDGPILTTLVSQHQIDIHHYLG